jgi:hypothetical protein
MFAEVFRVLKPGGRAVISDIVSDKEVPSAMQADEELWSGCISGALREDLFVKAFSLPAFGLSKFLSVKQSRGGWNRKLISAPLLYRR